MHKTTLEAALKARHEDRKTPAGFVSAQQVADLAGVSRSAVSRTFTPGASVAPATRERVLKAAELLGYHVNHLARGLLGQRTGIVCIVVADISTPFQSRLVMEVSQKLQNAGMVTMIVNTAAPEKGVEHALRQALHYRADATLVLSGAPSPSIIATCVESGQRLILNNRDETVEGCHHIGLDNAESARTALHAFLRAGCRRLALVSSAAGTPSLMTRERAFVEEARSAGLEIMSYGKGPTNYESGYQGAVALFAGRDRPDGVFCVTDLLACGLMDGARKEFGLRVPEDLCVIGFDDIEQAGWASYDLTTFAQPVEAIAETVTTLCLEDAFEGGRTALHASFIWRRSVRAARSQD